MVRRVHLGRRSRWRAAVETMSVSTVVAAALLAPAPARAQPVPSVPPIGRPPAVISAGRSSTCMLHEGRAYCWGENGDGQVGKGGRTASVRTPAAVDASGVLADVRLAEIAVGGAHTCALSTVGRAFCWGLNIAGQLGDGTTETHASPVEITESGVLAGVVLKQLEAGSDHSCALSTAGRVYCWGANDHGQIGDGTMTARLRPVAVSTSGALAGVKVVSISAGVLSTCALSDAGRAYCWGANQYGGIGDGTTTDRPAPVPVNTSGVLRNAHLIQIEAGESSCASSTDQLGYCWGRNDDGQLGDGTTTDQVRPVQAIANSLPPGGAAHGAKGYLHTCVLSLLGRVFCWGGNDEGGQLGNGSTVIRSLTPVPVSTDGVLNGVNLVNIEAGIFHTCGLSDQGQMFCWGENIRGQLGDGTVDSHGVPVAVGPLPARPTPPGRIVTTPGTGSIEVSWRGSLDLRGGTLSHYTATARPGGAQCVTSLTSCHITGLLAGHRYAVTVVATTNQGTSVRSRRSEVTLSAVAAP